MELVVYYCMMYIHRLANNAVMRGLENYAMLSFDAKVLFP